MDGPVIVVGFISPLVSRPDFPENSVILVEEPDVIRKRSIDATMADVPMLRELVPWEYSRAGAADEFVNRHPELRPVGVIPLVEYATPFAARLAERYGVPGAGAVAAQLLRDKSLLRGVTGAAGIANPVSEPVAGPEDVRRFQAAHPGPVVLKPADRQGSVGTKVLREGDDVAAAWAECQDQDEGMMVPDRVRQPRMLVETYVRGAEYSVEMLVRDGEPLFTNITEKVLFPGPRPIEVGHLLPADVSDDLAARLREGTLAVLRAVAFGSGVVHCEWIVADDGLVLVECAGRFPGDGIPEMIERAYPVELAKSYFAMMCGRPVDALPDTAAGGAAIRFLRADPGEIVTVDGVDAASATEGVVRATVLVTPGYVLGELRSSWDRAGSVMACAATAADAMRAAVKATEQITITVRPR